MFVLTEMGESNSIRVRLAQTTNPTAVVERVREMVVGVIGEYYEHLSHTVLVPTGQYDGTGGMVVVDLGTVMDVMDAGEGMWVGSAHVPHSSLGSLFRHWLPPMGLLPAYDLFFSYRWVS